MLLKILINFGIFILLLAASIAYLCHLKLPQKGYKYLFLVYMFYWTSIMLLRPYRGTLQNLINVDFVTIALAAYGIVGIVMRVLADYLNYCLKNRKVFLYLGALIQIILFIPVLIVPTTATSILQSVAIGIGASCIGSFELLFKEQYNPEKPYLTVSLLSVPPLVANFLTSPIQSIMVSASKTTSGIDLQIFKYLWLIGLVLAIIALVMIIFVKEDRTRFGWGFHTEPKITTKKDYSQFILLALIGLIITFVKFSNSGGVATLHLQKLGEFQNTDTSAYEGYLSMVFALFQLAGGVLVGTVLIKKIRTISIFGIGCGVWIIYNVSAMFVKQPIVYMVIHGINGFGYGLLYNLVLGKVLNYHFKTPRLTPMGVYQATLAIGITASSFYTNMLRDYYLQESQTWPNYLHANQVINGGLIGVIALLMGAFTCHYYCFDNKK